MKFEKEITVSINTSKEELIKFLENNNYRKINDYIVDDIYYVENKVDLNSNALDILKKCILVRTINETNHTLVYKYKEYDSNENIINEGKSKIQIYNREEAKEFLESIGYRELIHIVDEMNIYEKDGLELGVQYVNDKYLYIEVEENDKYNTIDKLKKALEETNIDYDKTDYFVKKAKIIFEEKYISSMDEFYNKYIEEEK